MSRTMMNNLRQSLNATKERVWTMIRPQQQQSDDLESSLTTVTASAKESTEKEKKQVGVFSLFLLGMSLG
jgi:cytochrome c biogenesis protein ResB